MTATQSIVRVSSGSCLSTLSGRRSLSPPPSLHSLMHPGVEVLARYHLTPEEAAEDSSRPASVVVAVRSGHLLATSFHPELVGDARWHALFADMVRETVKGKQREERQAREVSPLEARKPRDLPKH